MEEIGVRVATSKNQKGRQREVQDLFQNLSYWKKDLQIQFTNIISSYDKRIKKGINDHVSGLKTQLSVTTKERNSLIETVNDLNEEIWQLKARLLIAHPLTEPKDNDEDMQETNPFIEEISNDTMVTPDVIWQQKQNHFKFKEEINESGDEFTHEYVSNEDEEVNKDVDKQPRQHNTQTDDGSKRKGLQLKQKVHRIAFQKNRGYTKGNGDQKGLVCDECGFATLYKTALKRHKQAVHLRIANFQCTQCTFRSSYGTDLKRHIKGVHDRIKDYICEECGLAFSRKDNLNAHKRACLKKP